MCESKVLIEWCGYSRSIFLKTRADFRESILYRYICCSVLCNVPCAIVKKDFALYVFAVAPLAGAWVEIPGCLPGQMQRRRRSPCGSVVEILHTLTRPSISRGAPLAELGLKQIYTTRGATRK